MTRGQFFTHRGLEPSNPNFFSESSFEAFQDHLSRGFGIEFDPSFTKDGMIIFHDSSLERVTFGKDKRLFSDLTNAEALQIKLNHGRICSFDELMELIKKNLSKINALHLKGKFQKPEYLDKLLSSLQKYSDLIERILIFDAKPKTAKYLKDKISNLHLAPSVAHPYDIKRYNDAVLGTLMTVEEAINYKKEGLYDWVWLDEWDLKDENGKTKKLYTPEVFSRLKTVGYKIALVTPELHGTSPGLLGGEAHPDAQDNEILFARIKEIIKLRPDAPCTDYPEEVLNL